MEKEKDTKKKGIFEIFNLLSKNKEQDPLEEKKKKTRSFTLKREDRIEEEPKLTRTRTSLNSNFLSITKDYSRKSLSPRKLEQQQVCKTLIIGGYKSGKTKLFEEIKNLYKTGETSPKSLGTTEISFENDGNIYKFLELGNEQNERRFWQKCMSKVQVLIYIVSLSDYDVFLDDSKANPLQDSMDMFKLTCNGEWFSSTPILLIFNKFDEFKKKFHPAHFQNFFPTFYGESLTDAINFISKEFVEGCKNVDIHTQVSSLVEITNVIDIFETIKKIGKYETVLYKLSPNPALRKSKEGFILNFSLMKNIDSPTILSGGKDVNLYTIN